MRKRTILQHYPIYKTSTVGKRFSEREKIGYRGIRENARGSYYIIFKGQKRIVYLDRNDNFVLK